MGVEQISQSAIQQRSDSKYQGVIRSARQSGQEGSWSISGLARLQKAGGVGEG